MSRSLQGGQAPAFVETITVNDTCTLADAIIAANTGAPSGGCPAGSGHDTIVLPANTTFLSSAGHADFFFSTALPRLMSDITIEGNGSTLARRSGAPPFRILYQRGVGRRRHSADDLNVPGDLDREPPPVDSTDG